MGSPSTPAHPETTRTTGGPPGASGVTAETLLPQVYKELRALARLQMADERLGHTLQATALVHEAYLRLVGDGLSPGPGWAGRAHFLHAAAMTMRHILVEHARSRATLKRGGGGQCGQQSARGEVAGANACQSSRRVAFNVLELVADERADPSEIMALDDAVSRLEEQEPHLAALVRLRFYAGLSVEETAAALRISPRSVKRDWAFAKAWLFRRMGEAHP